MLDFAEKSISVRYSEAILDASLPAKHIDLKRGYVDIEFHTMQSIIREDVIIKEALIPMKDGIASAVSRL